MQLVTFLVLVTIVGLVRGKTFSQAFTVLVQAQQTECFTIDNLARDQAVLLTFQVTNTDAQTGTMDISLQVKEPHKEKHQLYFRTDTGTFSLILQDDGDFVFCLDNSYSTFAKKYVLVDYVISDPKGAQDDLSEELYFDSEELTRMQELDKNLGLDLELSLEEVKTTLGAIKRNMNAAEQLYGYITSFSTRDHHNAINVLSRINFWSLIHFIFIFGTSVMQVYMVKALFQ